MRRPRFRGFRRKTQEWVYGYLIEREKPYLHDIVVPYGDTSAVTYAVERDSIGEYTGLKDKKGKDIYTGDIYIDRELIKPGVWDEDIYEVCFYDGAYQIKGKITSSYRGEKYSEVRFYNINTINQRNMECIGNIFEYED